MSEFQLLGLDHSPFESLFELDEAELRSRRIVRRQASAPTGFPCRISLEDAAEGEDLLLLPYCHHAVESPYRSLGPIYIRKGARQAVLPTGVVPEYVSRRLISVRGYDAAHMMQAAEVCEGTRVAEQIQAQFADPAIAYIHLHNARPGCFSCLVRRV